MIKKKTIIINFKRNMSKLSILKDLWDFLKTRKRFWLAPIIIILVLLSLLMIFAQSSAVAPFIYTLF